jgi:hypothetical protein
LSLLDSITGGIAPYAGTNPDPNFKNSVYLSSSFLHKVTKMPIIPGATKLRFIITPLSSETFNILDAYLDPFPEITRPLAP